MATLHLFNPYNDLALAADVAAYTPPPAAQRLAEAGALLPIWIAQGDDLILAPHADEAWLKNIRREYRLTADLHRGQTVEHAQPWGWSDDATRQLSIAGVSELPDRQWLMRHRITSHRRTAAALANELRQSLPFAIPPSPIELVDCASLDDAVRRNGPEVMIKLPYSSSGRGIIDSTMLSYNELHRRVAGMIRRQGSVMVERKLRKVEDFAMLFYISDDGTARFGGYSLFSSERGVSYSGNRLMPDDLIRNYLSTKANRAQLDALEREIPPILSRLVGEVHRGWLGVDMLLYVADDGLIAIAPAIEINLRLTMGVVSHYLTERFYHGRELRFAVTPGDTPPGALPLTPPGHGFSFHLTTQT